MLSVNIYDNRNYLIKDIETEVKKIGFKTPSHQNWKFAAAVVDKFCMILFFVINTLFTVFMIFLQLPSIFAVDLVAIDEYDCHLVNLSLFPSS